MKIVMLCVLSMMTAACTGLADAQPESMSTDDTSARTADAVSAASTPTSSTPTSSPAAVGATFAGFSYHTNGVIKEPAWAPAIVDVMDFNTFTSASYNITTGTFTAPMAGYYRFNTHGFSPTVTPATDFRVGVGFTLNGATADHIVAIGGGQLSTQNSPMPSLSHIMHLNVGDKVSLMMFSDIRLVLGAVGPAGLNAYYFQGEYLGQ